MKLGFIEYFINLTKIPKWRRNRGKEGGGEGEKKEEGGGRKGGNGRKRKEGEGEKGKEREGRLDQLFLKVEKDLVCLQAANPGFFPDIDFFGRS